MNVLLIQLKRIGDLILTVPAITAVRTKFPDAKISLIVAHGSRELLPAIEGIDQTFVARGRISDAVPWFGIASGQFDYCLDFSRTDRSAFLTLLSGARTRVTYDTVRREPLRQLSYNQLVTSNVRLVHTVDYHLALLAPLGVRDAASEIRLVLPQAAKDQADAVISTNDLPRRLCDPPSRLSPQRKVLDGVSLGGSSESGGNYLCAHGWEIEDGTGPHCADQIASDASNN